MTTATTAFEIARALGGNQRAGRGYLCFCPAHDNRNTPALSIRDSDHGRVLWHCHGGCSQDAVRDALMARGLIDQCQTLAHGILRTPHRPKPKSHTDDTARRSTLARDIWRASVDPRGTLGDGYLGQRMLALPEDLSGRVLRFHPRCPFGEGAFVPALIAAFRPIRDSDDDRPPVAIHRIGLNADGTKIAKMMLGPVAGCAIKLDADEDVSYGLGITEGIETALAVRAAGWRPVWALGSAGAIRTFDPIPGIEALTIFADHDENQAGQAAAQVCAERWSAAGCEVTIRTPRSVGADWADVLT